jgi:hypothetical protein
MLVPFYQARYTRVGQLRAICQRESLDSFALHERLDGPIVDLVLECRKIQAPDHLMVWEKWILAEGRGYIDKVLPNIALWPMP